MKTAIEQAKQTFDRLVKMKINNPPLPINEKRNYSVATLPGGQVMMSDGSQQLSYPQKKINELGGDQYDQMVNQEKLDTLKNNMTLGVALPESQLGVPGQEGVDLIGFLGKFLKPQLTAAPEAGITTILPGAPTEEEFQRTSAFTNLPQLSPEVKSVFQESEFAKRFLQQGSNAQEALMKEFLAQANRGEVNTGQISRFNMPNIASYENRFGVVGGQAPSSAQIGTNVNQLTNQIK